MDLAVQTTSTLNSLTLAGLAERIGEKQVVCLLKQSLAEELGAEDKLRKIALGLIESAPPEDVAA
jgi:ferritin-like metal-binding protein YciE